MSRPILNLFAFFCVLFALLVAFTSRWTVFEAASLDDNPNNRRQIIEEARVKRGAIRAADGTVLARSVRADAGTYRRVYPRPELFPQPVGYSFISRGRAGLEEEYNDQLSGRKNEFTSIVEQLEGKRREGQDLDTNLDSAAQRVAQQGLAGRPGAVVAVVPSSGEVKVMASVPGYDPNDVGDSDAFRALADRSGAPLLNRTTGGLYPPGSTFKVVTAAAAIDSGAFTPDSTLDGSNGKVIGGVPLNNFGGQDFGTISLTEALTFSVNTVWGQVGEDIGRGTLARYMKRFGFFADPPVDLPRSELRASGPYLRGDLLGGSSRRIDVGREAIGQDKLQATPLQMAMVAMTIANGGVLVRPHLGDRVLDADGRTAEKIGGPRVDRVVSRRTADAVTAMMTRVVEEGSGTAAALQGIDVAGKTGTAEIDPARDVNQPWFIGFAPADDPRIAVAVTVERSPGTGGEVAAPIAAQVMESLLR